MYDDLIKALRDMSKMGMKYGMAVVKMREAADAIEELSAKAKQKRVGFAGWKGCRDTRYTCPYCNKYVRNGEKYCHKCGQALMFPRISHTPYVPGEKQDVIVTWPDEPPKEE
jgi:hypothetical protein